MSFTAKFDFLAIDKFSAPLRKMQSALNSIQSTIKTTSDKMAKLGASITKAGSSMLGFGSKMRSTGKGLFTSTTLPILGIAGAAIKSADSMEKLRITFNTFTGDATKTQGLLDDLDKFSMANAVDQEALENAATKMLAFGMTADKIAPSMKMLNDIAIGGGANLEELAGGFAMVKRTGEVSTRSVRAFAGANFDVVKALAIHLGKSKGQVNQLINDHKIKFKDLEAAMQTMTGKGGKYFDALGQRNRNLGGQLLIFKTIAGEVLEDFGTQLEKSFNLTENMTKFNKWLLETKDNILKFANAHPQLFKLMVILGLVVAVIAPLLIAIGFMASGVGAVVVGFGALITGGGALLGFLGGISAPVLIAVAALTALYFGLKKVSDMIGTEGWDKIFQLFGDSSVNEVNAMFANGGVIQAKQKVGVDVNVSGQVHGAKTKTTTTVRRGENMP